MTFTTVPRDILNPADGSVITTVVDNSAGDVDAAVRRAHVAQRTWALASPGYRASALREFARAVTAHRDELAALETSNAGHLAGAAAGGVDNVAAVLEYYAGGVERLIGDQIPVADGIDITFHEPVGVVAVIVPWNFPLVIAGWTIGPALAAGNAVIVKPSELTPLSALALARIALESGLPAGLLQVLPGGGPGTGDALVSHPGIGHVVFTGSTRAGIQVMTSAARNVTPVTLELGGKSPFLVFADADVEAAARSLPGAAFDNAGQDCCARTRVLVHRSVADRFLEALEPVIAGLRVGAPTDPTTDIGPLISAAQRDRVASFVDDDARIAFQGTAPDGAGFWFPPTVLRPASSDDAAWREEIFGPVVAVATFDDDDDAITAANDSEYGLSGSIWTNDLTRALRMSRAVRAGNLAVNSHSSVRYQTPFGGMKRSGIGRELGPHALTHFTETKNVFINTRIA